MSVNVLFYVQHLLGIGHVVRSSRIARALLRAGCQVTVAYGGAPVSGVNWGACRLVQLPAVSAGRSGFGNLVSETGETISDQFKDQRRETLLDLFADLRPDVLLIEAYPFARRIMRFELLPLLETAQKTEPRPLIVSSIRDILQEGRKPERITETRELVERFFDVILVHGEEEFAPLSLSFPEAALIAEKLHYTGWVGPEVSASQTEDVYEVIVSAGGGAVGSALFEAALSVRAQSSFSAGKWLVLAGPNLPENDFQTLKRKLPEFVTLDRFRPDLPHLLKTAKVSVSQAGYNTVADLMTAGCRMILVPYEDGGETEQLRRAQMLAEQGRAVVVRQKELSQTRLAAAFADVLKLSQPEAAEPLRGAETAASLICELTGRAG